MKTVSSKRIPASQLLLLLFFLDHGACKFDNRQIGSRNLVAVFVFKQGNLRAHENVIFTILGHACAHLGILFPILEENET